MSRDDPVLHRLGDERWTASVLRMHDADAWLSSDCGRSLPQEPCCLGSLSTLWPDMLGHVASRPILEIAMQLRTMTMIPQ